MKLDKATIFGVGAGALIFGIYKLLTTERVAHVRFDVDWQESDAENRDDTEQSGVETFTNK